MASPVVDPVAADPVAVHRTRGYRLASVVSYVLNPLIFPPVAFALIDWHFGASAGQTAWTLAVSLVFFCIVPLVYVMGLVRAGRVESLEVRDRASRLLPFLVCIGSYAVGALILSRTIESAAFPLVVSFAALYPLNTAGLLLINLRWKISIHMTSLAGFVGVLLFAALTVWRDLPAGPEAVLTLASVVPTVALLPLLMWARVRVGAHTVAQVVAGAVYGMAVPLVELYLIVYVWLGLAG